MGLWVANLPGAFGRVTLFGSGPLLLATAGLLVIGLLKTPLRWSGFALAALAAVWAAFAPVPDVLLAADGRTFAVRGPGGRLAFYHGGGDTFAIREWLAADADGRDVHDRGLGKASPAILPAGSAGSPMAASSPTDWSRMPSKMIADAPPLSLPCTTIRPRTAARW